MSLYFCFQIVVAGKIGGDKIYLLGVMSEAGAMKSRDVFFSVLGQCECVCFFQWKQYAYFFRKKQGLWCFYGVTILYCRGAYHIKRKKQENQVYGAPQFLSLE